MQGVCWVESHSSGRGSPVGPSAPLSVHSFMTGSQELLHLGTYWLFLRFFFLPGHTVISVKIHWWNSCIIFVNGDSGTGDFFFFFYHIYPCFILLQVTVSDVSKRWPSNRSLRSEEQLKNRTHRPWLLGGPNAVLWLQLLFQPLEDSAHPYKESLRRTELVLNWKLKRATCVLESRGRKTTHRN